MKLRFLAVATLAALTLTAGMASAQDTTSEKGKLSYALGYQLGREAIESGEALDVNTMVQAMRDGYAKKDPTVAVADMRKAYEGMQQRMSVKAKAAFDKAAAENKANSATFLGQYKAQAGVKTLPNGALYKVLEVGNGAKPTQASTVELEVSGPFPWGQMPQQVPAPQKMPGTKLSAIEMPAIREVLMQMPAGSKWEIALPPEKAFGADPRSPFPPNVAVVFQVKLVSVK
jgi:peptidylprolyl isomerase